MNLIRWDLSVGKQGGHVAVGGSVNGESKDGVSQRLFDRIPPSVRFEDEQTGRTIHLGRRSPDLSKSLTQLFGEPSDKTLLLRPNIVQEIKQIASGETHLTTVAHPDRSEVAEHAQGVASNAV